MIVVEQRRLAQASATNQAENAAAGRPPAAACRREGADRRRSAGRPRRRQRDQTRKLDAARSQSDDAEVEPLIQQLADLERWSRSGSRTRACNCAERAEALMTTALDAPKLAAEVRKLRASGKRSINSTRSSQGAVGTVRSCVREGICPSPGTSRNWRRRKKSPQAPRRLHRSGSGTRNDGASGTARLAPSSNGCANSDRTWRGGISQRRAESLGAFDARFRTAVAPLRDALAAARVEARVDGRH